MILFRFGFQTPIDYDDMQGWCGGRSHQWDVHKGKCGICGDPFEGPRVSAAYHTISTVTTRMTK